MLLIKLPLLILNGLLFGAMISSLDADQMVLGGQTTIGQSVRDGLKKSEIIPDVIDDFHPSLLLQVSYPSKHESVSLGNTINPANVRDTPVLQLHSSGATTSMNLYTIVLTDPDAPSHDDPKWSEMCHWIVINVPLTTSATNAAEMDEVQSTDMQTVTEGLKELVEYMPPSPPPKAGKHRYAFLVFERHDGASEGNITAPKERKHWGTGKQRHGVRQWASDNRLVPVGGNFFYSQNDEQ